MIVHRQSLTFVKSERRSFTGTALPSFRPSPAPAITGLAFLSLDIQRTILAGRQLAGLWLEDLVRNDVPTDLNEQQRWIECLAR